MKKRYLLYILCTLFIFGIIATLTWHTMDTRSMRQTAEASYRVVKRAKKCKCCAKQMTRIKEQIRTAQQRTKEKNYGNPRPL